MKDNVILCHMPQLAYETTYDLSMHLNFVSVTYGCQPNTLQNRVCYLDNCISHLKHTMLSIGQKYNYYIG